MNCKKISILYIALVVILIFNINVASAKSYSHLSEDIFQGKRYYLFSNEVVFSFDLVAAFNAGSITGELLEVKSKNGISRSILIDWDKERSSIDLFLHINHKFHKYTLPDISLDTLNRVSISLNFKRDIAKVKINKDSVTIMGMQLSINDGYAFQLLPQLATTSQSNTDPILIVENLQIYSDNIEQPGNAFYWYLFIVIVDIAIFIFIFVYNRRRKKLHTVDNDELFGENTLKRIELPRKSAIYLFGGLKIYDAEGNEVSHKLSPLLRELLSVLVIYSDGNGISASRLKDMLWFDKDPDSARNNRAVYIRRLRDIFANLGNISIINENGYWKVDPGEVFVDYLVYRKLMLQSGTPQKGDIENVLSITSNGGILPDNDYLWLDGVKGSVSSEIIDKLLNFAETDGVKNNVGVYFAISEAISKIESLNEDSLRLRCKAFSLSGRHQSAKSNYDRFCQEYKSVYGENFSIPFTEILK